eukprot:1377016-Pyramimonas_sp.AAC.1
MKSSILTRHTCEKVDTRGSGLGFSLPKPSHLGFGMGGEVETLEKRQTVAREECMVSERIEVTSLSIGG